VVHAISTFLRLCLMSILLQHNSGRSSLLFVNYFGTFQNRAKVVDSLPG
jgi:hypothetical protein